VTASTAFRSVLGGFPERAHSGMIEVDVEASSTPTLADA